jgi:hypothetical protein
MCMILDGEVRGSRTVNTTKGPLQVLNVLVNYGRFERIEQVANFSGSEIKPGKMKLQVVPKINVSKDGRGFLNLSTFEGAVA